MMNPFKNGDTKTYTYVVTLNDTAKFDSGEVHAVYSTFALARDAEWSGRLFVLEMKEEDEEGIGTAITVKHISPALVGQEVVFTALLTEVKGNEIGTEYTARIGERIIATGTQLQKILKKEQINQIFGKYRSKP